MLEKNVLAVEKLSIGFGNQLAVEDLSFDLAQGKTLGIVGESGSGKSLTSLAIMGLLPKNAMVDANSKIFFNGLDLVHLEKNSFQNIRGNDIGMIFQEPMTSLNPAIQCGEQVGEVIRKHQNLSEKDLHKKVIQLFEKVKLPDPERFFSSYPHQLSGGQRQRIMIAMAISCSPKLLIADEPTTALDVTVQKAILALIRELQHSEGMGVIFISHDLGVIAQVADEVLVMYRGKKVEQGAVHKIFNQPETNYTKGLIACRPTLKKRLKHLPTVEDFTLEQGFVEEEEIATEREEKHQKLYAQEPLLEIAHLSKFFKGKKMFFGKETATVKAVDDMNFKVYPGETLGLVGESGSGKTTLSRTLLLLEKPTKGTIKYRGKELTTLRKSEIRKLRKEIQIIFQDPYSSLNPREKVKSILTEPMKLHGIGANKNGRLEMAEQLLDKVGLSATDLNKYPHEFSGGQRQRIGIARILALQPKFIICDESVSALDVSVQAQVLNLLNNLKEEFGFTYIFISHDLAVVKYMSDRLLVMQHGKQMELGEADAVYQSPETEYTRELIDAIPELD